MRIVAVDPGGTCGIAQYDSKTKAFSATEQPGFDGVRFVSLVLLQTDVLVVESFYIGPQTLKKSRGGIMTTLEVIGALHFLAVAEGVMYEPQAPNERDLATPARLKKLGWWRPSKGGHMNSAAAHLLVACIRHKLIDPAMFLDMEEE